MADDRGRDFALDAAEHIIGMMKRGAVESDCLSEGADVILEAAEAKMQITDQKVEIALRKWWDLEPNQPLPWDTAPVDLHFKEMSMRDMRAALEAALKE